MARGSLDVLLTTRTYDHEADEPAGWGTCSVVATSWTDPDDASNGRPWYYLVTAVDACGTEGPSGSGFDGRTTFPRDDRRPTTSCP